MKTTVLHPDHQEVLEPLRRLVKSIVEQELDYRDHLVGAKNGPGRDASLKSCSIPNSDNYESSMGDADLIEKLSSRELEVLILVANGYSRNEISQALGVRYNTACTHISNVYCKLSISNVAEATQIAMRSGVLSQDNK